MRSALRSATSAVFYKSIPKAPKLLYLLSGIVLGKTFSDSLKAQANTKVRMGNIKIGGPWSMLDTEGNTLTDQDFKGSYLVYYFGFARCPDVCPRNLVRLSGAIDILKQRGVNEVKYLFVSLDPESDTPESVKEFVNRYSENIKGAICPEEGLSSLLKNFKLYRKKFYQGDDYMIDHTSYMFLFDKQGNFVNILGENLSEEELADVIEKHVKG